MLTVQFRYSMMNEPSRLVPALSRFCLHFAGLWLETTTLLENFRKWSVAGDSSCILSTAILKKPYYWYLLGQKKPPLFIPGSAVVFVLWFPLVSKCKGLILQTIALITNSPSPHPIAIRDSAAINRRHPWTFYWPSPTFTSWMDLYLYAGTK